MNLPVPFLYPSFPLQRRHGPSGYTEYGRYKPWLRDEFCFRCVYCLERENWYPDRANSFSADHIVAQSQDASRICDYLNLVYACTRCNSFKIENDILDPTSETFHHHLRIDENGNIDGLTESGCFLIRLLKLDKNPALQVRRYYLRLLNLKRAQPEDSDINQLFLDAFGYPADMPDLRTLQRKPNSLPHGVETCYFVLRERGLLPPTY